MPPTSSPQVPYRLPLNTIEFVVHGREALFTDPMSRLGGDKFSYHVPTYEALKGVCKSVYWKPVLTWVVEAVRVLNPIRTHSRNMKPLDIDGVYPSLRNPGKRERAPNTLAIYTYLADVAYQVRARFEWNLNHPELAGDRNAVKHAAMAHKALQRGGRQDVFLGTRECQAYVEPCVFGAGSGHHDLAGELAFGLMFHGFEYPDESGRDELAARLWRPVMVNGCIEFAAPQDCPVRRVVRPMRRKRFTSGVNMRPVDEEAGEEA